MPKGVYNRKKSKAKKAKKVKSRRTGRPPKRKAWVATVEAKPKPKARRKVRRKTRDKRETKAAAKASDSTTAEATKQLHILVHTKVVRNAKINPFHYAGASQSGQQVIDVLEDFKFQDNAYRWQAIQYMFRAGLKNEAEVIDDLLKAIWYIEREIAYLIERTGSGLASKRGSDDARMAS